MKQTTYYLLIVLISLNVTSARAQLAYSMHTLVAGESLSNLAKSHHTTVGDIMRLNGMNAQSQLHIGDKIKIPASTTVIQTKPVVAASTPAPAVAVSTIAKTHVVATGETLYRISQTYKIPVERLMALNNLQDGNVKLGQTLVVSEGTIPQSPAKTRTEQSAPVISEPQRQNEQAETIQAQQEVKQPVSTNTNVTTPLPSQKPDANPPVTTGPPSTTTTPEIDIDNSNSQQTTYSSLTDIPKEGFFTSLYGKEVRNRSEKTKNGAAMTFKSASGWADKKYYILMNDVPSGSIVKIKNGNNELYAKVLWNLGDMKENDGLDFRISTAAAAALGISDQKFPLTIVYH